MVSSDSTALCAQPKPASMGKMGLDDGSPDILPNLQQFPDLPYMYVPYLADTGGDAEPNPTPHATSSTEPMPDGDLPPIKSLSYPQRVKILQELQAELKSLEKELHHFLLAENSRWNQWHRSQKDLAGWQAELTSSRFGWWKKKWARFRYSESSRSIYSFNLHNYNWWGKYLEAKNKQYVLKAKAGRRLRELDKMDKAEEERRLRGLAGWTK
ncbi:hypothetical protein B0T25DRAFT_536541 [Lasiosphaeria hispida]|uniref:Uncharacterized protein n=1 Tax=Lasiosphaeria hispida TaxID=260671 RepID=A0AAJ0MF38_9PEZI|nr:hypothetical protein B0T25DRAFT_536541 [Lasiosphaeria hispida]